MLFSELKRHIDKLDEEYTCDLHARGADWVVLIYVSTKPWTVAGAYLPVGSKTLAFYKDGASQVLWQMSDPAGHLIGYLFHVCRELHIGKNTVSYLDLLLDVWVNAMGKMTVLDRDDVEACKLSGKLNEDDLADIEAGELQISARWNELVKELGEILDCEV